MAANPGVDTGCRAWHQHGPMPPQCVRDATTAYLKAEDAIGQWLAECCAQRRRSANQMRPTHRGKAGRAQQRNLGSKKAFTQKLEDRGYGQRHGLGG
jgi:putative DNA primase/helicase